MEIFSPSWNSSPVWRSEIVAVLRLYSKLVRILETENVISAWVETVRVCSSLKMYFKVVQRNYLSNLQKIYILKN